MGPRSFLSLLVLSLCALSSDTVSARSGFAQEFQSLLYAGRTDEAASMAQTRIATAPDDDNARFALGAAQFLRAIEKLGQGLHRHGLQSTYQDRYGMTGLPFLRLPVPDNPNPEELTYAAIRDILASFVAELSIAEATLGKIHAEDLDLPLNIGLIRLDLDGDGKGSEKESLWHVFKTVTGAEDWLLDGKVAEKLLTDFDASDVPWLRAYCHLLMALAEFPLAHDWQQAFDATFPSIFHMPGSETGRKFDEAVAVARARLAELPSHTHTSRPSGMTWDEWRKFQSSPEYQARMRISQRRQKYETRLGIASIADLIAFLHLMNWPVVEPERLANVLQHFEAVVRLSRQNWKLILSEKDNRNEWIPSPAQTGVLPGMTVTQERVDGWQEVLGEFEHILKGTKLIPHWRFDEGINFRRMLLEPRTFDLVLLIQGSAAVPYLEKGPIIDGARWFEITRVFGGDSLRYFVWFN